MGYFCHILLILVLLIGFSSQKPVFAVADDTSLYSASDFFNFGLESLRQDNYQQALSHFTQVIAFDNNLVEAAYHNRCLVHFQLKNYAAAQSDCAIALQRNPDNLEASLTLGLVYYQLNNYSAAIAQYQQIIDRNERDYRAYYNRGLAYFARQNYQQALADYNKALMSPNLISNNHQISLYSDRGLAELMLTNYDKAIADFNRAINLDNFNQLAYFNRGCAYYQQGNYPAAIEDFTLVLHLNPNQTQAYVNRGWLYHRLGLEQAAFQDLNIAIGQYQVQKNSLAYQQTLALKERLTQIISQLNLNQWG